MVRVVRDWYNVRERGLPTGIGPRGSKLGPAIAPLILTTLMLSFGWRWMFVFMGMVGDGMSLVRYAVYREPRDVDLTADEKAYLADGEVATPADQVTRADGNHLFAYRATWHGLAGQYPEL